jgi:hypothetical protein
MEFRGRMTDLDLRERQLRWKVQGSRRQRLHLTCPDQRLRLRMCRTSDMREFTQHQSATPT